MEEALKQDRPDISTDEAKDFVMNILKATGLAPFEEENVKPAIDKQVRQAVEEQEKRRRDWHESIHRMADSKFQDFDRY